MLVLPDFAIPFSVDSLTAPIVIKHCWMFRGIDTDFTLLPILYLEETTGAAVKVRINNSEFWIPATWNILVTDRDTFQLDTVNIQSCAATKHIAFVFAKDELKLRTLDIMVLDYCDSMSLIHPMIGKGTALVHPVGPSQGIGKQVALSVVIGPHDLYKYLSDKIVGDIFS